jgi:glycosyltransferase involved in cell wall biosynthesis
MRNRRVLWFVNKVPAEVARGAGMSGVRGGWLDSYIEIVGDVPSIDLTVAFPDWTWHTPRTRIGRVTFVGLPPGEPESRPGRVIRRWRHDAAPRDVCAAAARLAQEVDPDLVHIHGADNCYGSALSGCGMPTVLSIQGSPTAILGLYLRGVDRYLLRSLSPVDFLMGRGGIHQHFMLKSRAESESRAMVNVGHVAGRTEWDERLAAVMAPQAEYHRFDEPMRLDFYRASWSAETARPASILSITGQYALKGVGTLLRATAVLRRVRPDTTLVLAGIQPGTEHERAATRHMRALGIEDCATIVGELDAPALIREMTRASVYVSPSHMENSSNALCEAQLVGMPCVASCAGGSPTIADHGSAALLVQDGDPEALAGAVLSLLDDPEEAARLGQRGRVLATARHDRERIRGQILSIYDEMLA